jgi:Flp pilus assembly protein TadB
MTQDHLVRPEHPRGLDVTRTWWKFVVAGPAIILAVIIGSGVGIDAWFVAFSAVIFAFMLIAVGLVLGVAHLILQRRSVVRA